MFDNICERLFGEGKEHQRKLLTTLLLVSLVAIIVAIAVDFKGAYAAMFLVWGWSAMRACVGMLKVGEHFEFNPVVIIIAGLAWLTLGVFAGAGVCIIGIIRFIQLIIERYIKKEE